MAITWQQARDKVRGDLWRPGTTGVPDDVCDRALHASLKNLEAERKWLWLETIKTTDPVVEDMNTIDAPAWRALQSVAPISDAGVAQDPLSIVTIGRILVLQKQLTAPTGPSGYTFTGGKIYMDSPLAAGWSLQLVGTAKTPDDIDAANAGAADNDTLQLHQTIIIAAACADVALTYLKNSDEASRQDAAYQRYLLRLENEDDEARSDNYGGLIQPDTAYRDMATGYWGACS